MKAADSVCQSMSLAETDRVSSCRASVGEYEAEDCQTRRSVGINIFAVHNQLCTSQQFTVTDNGEGVP
jgi:hypothetical protein